MIPDPYYIHKFLGSIPQGLPRPRLDIAGNHILAEWNIRQSDNEKLPIKIARAFIDENWTYYYCMFDGRVFKEGLVHVELKGGQPDFPDDLKEYLKQ
jgi:hypothetical protein